MHDVVCVGNICVDVIGKYIDQLPDKGKLEFIESVELYPGGCATNVSAALAKLGLSAAVCGKIGDDGLGDIVYHTLQGYGVNVSGLKRKTGLKTSSSIVVIGRDSERTFLHSVASNADFREDDIDEELITHTKVMLITGACLLPGLDGQPAARVLQKARSSGAFTAMDTAWDPSGRWMEAIAPCFPLLDLFIPSREEAEMLSNKRKPEEMAEFFRNLGVRLVVIKLGKEGCYIRSNEESFYIPAFKVQAIDATGAGDAFVAGFIAGKTAGWDLKRCGIFANAAGAHCVMAVGASAGIKTIHELEKFIDIYKL